MSNDDPSQDRLGAGPAVGDQRPKTFQDHIFEQYTLLNKQQNIPNNAKNFTRDPLNRAPVWQ